MKVLLTVGLLVLSNTFMTVAWYGHLKFAEMKWFSQLGLIAILLIGGLRCSCIFPGAGLSNWLQRAQWTVFFD
ncbi:DMT family protein [Mangrovibacterium lignilyticum]|uniref:DMT family protein n=1 Tax=Mangrovibacterium lignilyticum TaxID=2668052 RepID=UPI0019685586|nr:DMT family protein [Mangrovibacterium lignilyticum]